MTTLTTTARPTPRTSPDPGIGTPVRPTYSRIPLRRVAAVELRKMFDTRSGAWLMAGIAILAALATGAVVAFAPEDAQDYETFASAIGFPMAVILPVIAILSVTSEWSQRTGLTTFTFVPGRGRVIAAKAMVAVGVGVVSMLLAAGIGAVGNVVGTAIAGTETVWNVSFGEFSMIVVANVLGILMGFMLGLLFRSSAGAVVGYFVYSFVLPPLSAVLAASQEWWRDLQPWVDFNYAHSALFEGLPSPEQWAHLAVAGSLWLVIPLAIGVRLVMRAEVK